MLRITYDSRARAVYIYLRGTGEDDTVSRTQEIDDRVHVDLDTNGDVVGIELLDVDEPTVETITTPCICELADAPGAGEQEP